MSKKTFEIPFLSGLMIPMAIVIGAAAIIYGMVSLLTTERSYKDLVSELHTKTFGNRWVAAFELSKHLATAKIPQEDIPWLISNLSSVYEQSTDARTRNFIIMALGTIKSPQAYLPIAKALTDSDSQVQFHAIVSLGNMPLEYPMNWSLIYPFLKSPDPGLRQVAALTLAHHKVPEASNDIELLLKDENRKVRYAAATALIYFKRESAIPYLQEILLLQEEKNLEHEGQVDALQVENLKLNVINALGKVEWSALNSDLEKLTLDKINIKVSTKAKEVLKLLKN